MTAAELKDRITAERTGLPHLVFYDGTDRQRIVMLGDERVRYTLGRRRDNDIPLFWDHGVSRAHAFLERLGVRDWALVDDGLSRHGTFVNGRRLRGRIRLHSGDGILIGSTELLFRAPPDDETETPELPARRAPELPPARRAVLLELCRPYAARRDPSRLPSNNEIAEALFLAPATVKWHMHELFVSFGVADAPPREKRRRLAERALELAAVDVHERQPPLS